MTFFEFCRRHLGFVTACVLIVISMLALDDWVLTKRAAYTDEIARLRSGMSDFERKRSDAILSSRERRLQVMMQLIRRQARWDKDIHLAISVEPERWAHLKGKLDDAGIHYALVDEVSIYFNGPDGERLELIADPLGEMYGMQVL